MTWTVSVSHAAAKDIRKLEPKVASRIIEALERYARTGDGDVKRLQGTTEMRLRVGDWRVRFERRPNAERPDTGTLEVLRVLHRREAYR